MIDRAVFLFMAFAAVLGSSDPLWTGIELLNDPFTVQQIPGYIWALFRDGSFVREIGPVYMTPFCFYIAHYAVCCVVACMLLAYALRPGDGPRSILATLVILALGVALSSWSVGFSLYAVTSEVRLGPKLGQLFYLIPFAIVGLMSIIDVVRWRQPRVSWNGLLVVGAGCLFVYTGTVTADRWTGKAQLVLAAVLVLYGLCVAIFGKRGHEA